MRAILLAASLTLFALAPLASASAPNVCTPPVSQWGACVVGDCVILDGAAFHKEACAGDYVTLGYVCTPWFGQVHACAALPCSVVDGPAMHRVVCLPLAA